MTNLNSLVRHEVAPLRVWTDLEAVGEDFKYEDVIQTGRELGRLGNWD